MPSRNTPSGGAPRRRDGRTSTPKQTSNPKRASEDQADGSPVGVGQEGSRGIHGAKGPDDESKTQRPSRGNTRSEMLDDDSRPGSEPLKNRSNEHVSGYGGQKGNPKRSSDQR